jgi:hypothetical protein
MKGCIKARMMSGFTGNEELGQLHKIPGVQGCLWDPSQPSGAGTRTTTATSRHHRGLYTRSARYDRGPDKETSVLGNTRWKLPNDRFCTSTMITFFPTDERGHWRYCIEETVDTSTGRMRLHHD